MTKKQQKVISKMTNSQILAIIYYQICEMTNELKQIKKAK